MPNYKLTYFDGPGRAEAIRLLFAAAGVAYEDVRITVEEWHALKASGSRCGILPLLEVDGKQFTQSRAIANLVAREHGFYPPDNTGSAQVDEIVFIAEDFFKAFVPRYKVTDNNWEELTKAFVEKDAPKYLEMLETLLKSSGTDYFWEKLSLADIVVFDLLSYLKENHVELPIGKYPKLKDLLTRVADNPGIKNWMDKRPKFQY